ncbi:hypothetical protein QE418_003406 [Microbacterium testaceum]|nr:MULTISPECIES: hypothetical protein [Microbacterium]MDQ1113958.1 hypothetical protein [Microbacterium testaceum]MDR6098936.1 hypothetical protein [Microbacterium sp. SORGH_AS_0454]
MPENTQPTEFVCEDCGRSWTAEISLVFCCNPAALGRFGATAD